MKIRFYLATAIVALSWMGCSQEEATNEIMSGANVIQATIESSSRSAVTDAGVFSWTTGDEISLLDESNNDTYTYSGSGNDFTPLSPVTVTTPVVAYYPANENHNTTEFYLPDTYGNVNTEYVASTNAAMIATPPTEDNTYAFMHLGGVMRFNVKNVPVGVNEFRFIAKGKKINGYFEISSEKTINTSDNTTDDQSDEYLKSIVQILFKPLTEAKDMTFYVPLPVGTYGDYEVAIKGDGLDIWNPSTGVTNTIERRTLLLMPTFTYNGTILEKGEAIDGVIDLQDGTQSADIADNAEVVVIPGTADATATLNYTPKNDGSSVLSISDGSGATESGESEGKVVVSTASGSTVASCEINTPSLTVELSAAENGSATFSDVTALTAEQTLIIGEGVTVTNLMVKGGNVRVLGTVSAISRAEGNTDEVTCVIYEDENKIPETLGENVVAVSAADYAAECEWIAAFAAGGEVTLEADMTLHKSLTVSNEVTLNLNGKTLTGTVDGYLFESSGNLTISGGNIVNTGGAVKTTDGTLTMTDCNVTVTGNKRRNAVYIQNITNAVITGGKYTATGTLAEGEKTDWYGIGIVDGELTLNTTVEGTFNGGVTLAPDGTRPNVTITGGSYSGQMYYGLNMNGGDLILTEDAEMEFNGNGGDIRIYTKTGTVNDVVFDFTLEGKKNYTLEELMAVIAEKKASAE